MVRKFGEDAMIWSKGMYDLLALDGEEVSPSFTLLQSMKHPEDRLTFAQVEDNLRAARIVSGTFRVIRRDGTLRYLSQKAELLFDRDGKPEKLISIVTDVTNFEVLHERGRTTARRLKVFTQHSNILLNLVRPDGFVTRILSSDPADESGQTGRYGLEWRELIHPDERAESVAIFEKAACEGTIVTREHRVLQKDGGYRWRRAKWMPVFDDKKALLEYVVMSQDIEEKNDAPDQPVTGAQVRAARGLLGWSVQKLADTAKVPASTIRRIEEFDGAPKVVDDALPLIRAALSEGGVEFVFAPSRRPGIRPAN